MADYFHLFLTYPSIVGKAVVIKILGHFVRQETLYNKIMVMWKPIDHLKLTELEVAYKINISSLKRNALEPECPDPTKGRKLFFEESDRPNQSKLKGLHL